MKYTIYFFLIFLSTSLYGQNVGINKSNPAQPLDVSGNVNVDGKILVNGVEGTAGQVLQTTSSGATAWVNSGKYTYVRSFTQDGNFTVPDGVTRLLIEVWAAGGGGSSGGGGAAGMYLVSVQDVSPGAVLTISIGLGGANATTYGGAATDGGNTTVSGLPSYLTAAGGHGAFASGPGYATRYGVSSAVYIQYTGQNGDANTFSYAQKNSNIFAIIRKYGDGGAAGPYYNRRSQGETRSYNESNSVLLESNNPTLAPYPGGGGGGGYLGEDGANGMVQIWY
jgi:hypothetical protein